MGHLFYFVCKANQVIICQHWKTWQGAGVNLQSLSFRSDGSNASYSFSHLQWPFLVFPHRIVNETETKNSWNSFFCGCGGMREEEQGEGERGQLWWNAPGMSSLGSRASSFQTADSAASSSSQGRSLVKCKMSNGCESLPSLPLPFSVFLLFFYLIFFTLPATRESYQWQIWQTWTSLWCVMMPSNRVQLKGFAQRSYMLALISPLTVSPAYNCLGCTKLPCISGVIT